ncbi:hypothetical protein RN001_002060 [Aquatica leii]|uniref:Uncharacterized protein n=1 Tax=Aquatica leii TaxID=1421715 RepID=A0AAN7PGK9_9COLE|nr:hypothetical protein RN001_002060 [Aquatica leii]
MDQYIQRSNSIGSNEDLRRQPKRKKEDRESEESKQLQLMEEILQQITALRQDNLEIKNELKTLKEKYESLLEYAFKSVLCALKDTLQYLQ